MVSRIKLTGAIIASLLVIASASRATIIDIDITYSNLPGAKIQFDGASHFTFTPAPNNFRITSGNGVSGLLGEITGVYTIGAVTKVGTLSTAPVSGVGSLVIHDGFGFDLTSSLSWLDIVQSGPFDALNTAGTVNLTGVSYGGLNPTLQLLAQAPSSGATVVSFQFLPAKSLAQLKTTKAATSFSGSIHASRVPEVGSSLSLLGVALAAVALMRRRAAFVATR